MQTPGTVGRGGSLAWHGGSGGSDRLAELTVAVEALAAQNLDGLADAVRAERVLVLRRLVDRLEGQWLNELAGVDARGAAGAELGQQVGSTAGWLRARLRLGARAAAGSVRTARALFGGPLTGTAQALIEGTISAVHASVVAHGTCDLLDHRCAEAEPILVEAACRLDPPRLRRVLGHLRLVADPDGEHDRTQQRRRGLWLAPTFEGMVAVGGLLEPEAGQLLLAVLEPLARPADTNDARSGSQRRADALAELARRALESGRLPQTGGVRPQLTVTVDMDSLLGRQNAVGGEAGAVSPLDPEACRRLACDGAVTRVLITATPTTSNTRATMATPTSTHPRPGNRTGINDRWVQDPSRHERPVVQGPNEDEGPVAGDPGGVAELGVRLRVAMSLLPPVLGGAPTQPLEVGRATRVVQSAQRTALAVRDGGCVVPDCSRPLAWCEAHHRRHPTAA